MTDQLRPVRSGRSYVTLAASIVVAAVIISAAIFATLGSRSTRTVYEVTTAAAQTTTTQTVISTSSATPTTSVASTETCTPAMTRTQGSNNSSTTEVITFCHLSYRTAQPQSTTSSPQALSGHGVIQILNGTGFETFTYTQWNTSTPGAFTVAGVTFSLWTNTTVTYSGGSCYGAQGGYGGYVIRFADGSSQTMTTCTVGPNPPIALRLTNHTKPQAGLLIVPSTGAVYFLVSG